jgi:hypothetical protein
MLRQEAALEAQIVQTLESHNVGLVSALAVGTSWTCPFILSMDRYGLSRTVHDDDMSIYSIHGQVWTLSNRTR